MNLKRLPLILLTAGTMCAPLAAQENASATQESTPAAQANAAAATEKPLTTPENAPAGRESIPVAPERAPSPRGSGLDDVSAARLSPETRLSPRPPTTLFTQDKSTGTGQLVGYFLGLMALAGVGLYFMKRGFQIRGMRGGENQLHLLETKMLGNRQFLVVVKYQDNKMLLGVGPGQIQYLCSLDSADADMEELIRESQQHPPGPGLI